MRQRGPTRPSASLLACLAALGLVLAGPAVTAGERLESAEAVEQCVRDNAPAKTSKQTLSLEARDRLGGVVHSRATLYWKKFPDGLSKAMIRFSEPSDVQGTGILMIEREERDYDLFIYLPETRRVRRVNRRAQNPRLVGSDITFEQAERLLGFYDESVLTLRPDSELDGRPVYLLAGRPAEGSDADYEKFSSWIDQQTCVPLRIEYYENGEQLKLVVQADTETLTTENGVHLPLRIEARDAIEETETIVRVEAIEIDGRIRDSMFTTATLERGGH